ncbi:MAG: hypothetical protein EOO03_05080 [Chitinophagaceae bacterium]|nr:MAG: hypothetical protein EOO03_05080 [Chitinophagaceae bacterium]
MTNAAIIPVKQTNCSVQAYTTRQLAALYQVSPKVFLRWIKPFRKSIGKKNGWHFNHAQVALIFSLLGAPGDE